MIRLLEQPKPILSIIPKTRAVLAWLGLSAVLATSVYGIVANQLFKQVFWTPSGLQRLAFAAVAYTLWCGIFLKIAPRWFASATVTALLALLTAGVWPLPVFAVLLFLFSCYVTGAALLRSDGADLSSGLLQLVLGISVWMAAAGVMVHFKVNYAAVYLVLLAAPCALNRRLTLVCFKRCARVFRPVQFARKAEYYLLALAGFPVIFQLLVVMKPETGADALAMHLTIPAWVNYQHYWHFDFHHIAWAVMPMGADWCYTAVYLLGGEFAARLLNFACFAALVAFVYAASQRYAGRGPGLFFAALFASTPLILMVTASLFVENLWALVLFGAVVSLDRFRATAEPRMLYLTAVLLGAGLATKFGSLPFLVPMLAFIAREIVRSSCRNRLRMAAVALVLLLLFGAAPYVFAYVKTGNPVFPFMNNVFKSPAFDATPFITTYSRPLSVLEPYQAVFQTHKHLESYDGAFGFQHLFFLALAVAAFSRRWPYLGLLSFGVAIVFSVLTFAGQAYVRYLYPALPLMTVVAAIAYTHLASNKGFSRAVLAALSVVFVLNIYFLPSSTWLHGDFFLNPFKPEEVREHLAARTPVRFLTSYLNRNHPGEPVAFFEAGDVAGLRAKAYAYGWHYRNYERQASLAGDAAGYGRFARDLGIRWFIAPVFWSREPASNPIRAFLNRYTDPEYAVGAYEIRRLNQDGAALGERRETAQRPLPPCGQETIDDASPRVRYSGKWRRLQQFGQACNATLTYTDSPGAEASFRFTGTSVTYIHTKAYTRGAAEILIDGVKRQVLDPFSPEIEWRSRYTLDGLPPGQHTLTIRVLHAKATMSQGFDVDVDGFLVP